MPASAKRLWISVCSSVMVARRAFRTGSYLLSDPTAHVFHGSTEAHGLSDWEEQAISDLDRMACHLRNSEKIAEYLV